MRKELFGGHNWRIYTLGRLQIYPFILFLGFGVPLVLLFRLRKFLDKCLGCNCVDSDKD